MQSTIERVLGRLLTDNGFRNQMMLKPQQALAGYNLGQEELDALGQLDLARWTKVENGDERNGFPDIVGGRRTL